MAQLTCKNLALGYDGRTVVKDVSFSLSRGDYLCIVGENGAGKSTLMKTVLGLRKPLRGSMTYGDGVKHTDVGYLPQQTEVQRDFPASVREIVLSGFQNKCGLRPFYTKKEKEAVKENLRKMEAEHLEKKCFRELSGGQQQRVLLARALCAGKKMLFLDEPVSGLDPNASAEMYDLIKKLNVEDGMTIVMISHDLEAALTFSTHILHLGKEVFFGTKEEYRESDVGKGFMEGNND